jgi:dsDNA-specific endonuclease/ATPase MutS2
MRRTADNFFSDPEPQRFDTKEKNTMEKPNFKFKVGDSVRIIASGHSGKVIDHRDDRDDEVNTEVEFVDGTKRKHHQWCRETELGSVSASEETKADEQSHGKAVA